MIKGLEALENIKKLFIGSPIDLSNQFNIIENELKALEIIKEKKVDIDFLFEEWIGQNDRYILENYNYHHIKRLVQEDIDLLKEVLL